MTDRIEAGPLTASRGHTGKNSHESKTAGHGVFTQTAYAVAWAIAIFGSVLGVIAFLGALSETGNDRWSFIGAGVGLFLGGWVTACGIGTLAEISRKLTPRT